MRNSIIAGIVLIVVGGLITKFFFDDKTELRYVISDRIPTNFFDGKESESIQQLELLNTGDTELQRIIIKIKTTVLEYYIQKVAFSDSIIISKANRTLEIIYPQIPPEGNIKIIIKSAGEGVSVNDLDIKHSKGSAKPALETNNSIGFAAIGLMLLYLIFTLYGLRTTLIESVANKVNYSPYDDILKRSKPWYISLNKWKQFREDSLRNIFTRELITNITNTSYYQILDTERHKNISDDEWIMLKIASQKKLLNRISESVNKGYSWKIDEFISLRRPKNIDEDVWKEIKSIISNAYVTSLILKVRDYYNQDEIVQLLKKAKPEIIDEDDWKKYQSFLHKFQKLNTLLTENSILRELFNDLIFGNELKEKPDKITIDDWERLKRFEKEIFEKSSQINEDLIELEDIKRETIPLKEKLERQLKIIHEVLNDPTAIDRIEEYSNPFSTGNFENLKIIAQLIKNK